MTKQAGLRVPCITINRLYTTPMRHSIRLMLLVWLSALALGGCSGAAAPSEDAGSSRPDAGPDAPVDAGPDAKTPVDGGPWDAEVIDAGADGGPPIVVGEPIEVSSDQRRRWVWQPMPTMRCADGSEGGFAVNFTEELDELVVYLQGGGICYDAITCAASLIANVGDDPPRTALEPNVLEGRGIFDRDDPHNPFREASFVVLPHCTGDHHTGDAVTRYGGRTVHHRGYANVARLLERLLATFRETSRVTLTGFSAGGVGVSANYHQLARGFEGVGHPAPFLVIDGGPFLRNEYLSDRAQGRLREAWNLDGTVGEFCPECLDGGVHRVYEANARLHPALRMSMVCAYEDSVVATLYAVMNTGAFPGSRLRAGLGDLADSLSSLEPMRFFFYGGDRHGALSLPLAETPGLSPFLTRQLEGGAWDSVRP